MKACYICGQDISAGGEFLTGISVLWPFEDRPFAYQVQMVQPPEAVQGAPLCWPCYWEHLTSVPDLPLRWRVPDHPPW